MTSFQRMFATSVAYLLAIEFYLVFLVVYSKMVNYLPTNWNSQMFPLSIVVDVVGLCSKSISICDLLHFPMPPQLTGTLNSNILPNQPVHQHEIVYRDLGCITIPLSSFLLDLLQSRQSLWPSCTSSAQMADNQNRCFCK